MPMKTEAAWLAEIRSCNDATLEGERLKIKAIAGARKAEISWEKIAQSLGVTRQAVMERYKKHIEVLS
jgi:predicted transcriptional regulator